MELVTMKYPLFQVKTDASTTNKYEKIDTNTTTSIKLKKVRKLKDNQKTK